MQTRLAPTLGALACAVLFHGPIAAAPAATNSTWEQLHSADLTTFAANLRATGFPEETVGLLVSQQVNARFAERESALRPSTLNAEDMRKFWAPEVRDAWLKLHKEKNDLMRSLLGTAPEQRAYSDWVAVTFPRLERQQRDNVRMITDDYDQLVQRVMSELRGYLTEDDRDMLEYLEREREKDLAGILTELEVLDYQIQRSRFGRFLRAMLDCFEPTPDEMRTCYRLGIKHGLAGDALGMNTNFDRRREITQAIEDELATLWTAERVAEYRRSTAAAYRRTYQLVRRMNLPRTIADRLYDSQVALGDETREISRTPPPRVVVTSATPPGTVPDARATIEQWQQQRTEKIVQALSRHMALVQSLLGDDGFKEYYSAHQFWIDRMRDGMSVSFTPTGFRTSTSVRAP